MYEKSTKIKLVIIFLHKIMILILKLDLDNNNLSVRKKLLSTNKSIVNLSYDVSALRNICVFISLWYTLLECKHESRLKYTNN